MSALDDLVKARAEVERLERLAFIEARNCVVNGHVWEFYGGANCGCEGYRGCSVPVHRCAACGDCDYGDNAEATTIRAECAKTGDDAP